MRLVESGLGSYKMEYQVIFFHPVHHFKVWYGMFGMFIRRNIQTYINEVLYNIQNNQSK